MATIFNAGNEGLSARHWHVLGAGAMGCLFARQLHGAGCPVTLLLREPPATATGEVTVEEADTVSRVPVALDTGAGGGKIDHLLVATKAFAVAGAIASVAQRLRKSSQVVLAANGMGFLDAARDAAGTGELYCCTTTEGAYRLAPLHIRHAGRGTTLIGRPGGGTQPDWLDDWLHSPLDCRWAPDIDAALWHKLAINCAINPLTAVHRCRNGELAARPALRREVAALCAEIAAVSRAAGFADTAASIAANAFRVIDNTAHNRSSMLQDVLAGRPTELDYITGHLLQTGRRLGVETPENLALYRRLTEGLAR